MTDWTASQLIQNREINKHRNVLQWINERLDLIEKHLPCDHAHPLKELIQELKDLADGQ